MSSSDINKLEFTDIGELQTTDDGGLVVVLPFGKALRRVTKHLIGKRLEVNFKLLKYQRSNAQNRWLWGVAYVTIAAFMRETTGEDWDRDAIHAYSLKYILGYEVAVKTIKGKEVLYMKGKSTSKLSTQEFNDMKERLQQHWAEQGCIIPDPVGNNFLSDFLED